MKAECTEPEQRPVELVAHLASVKLAGCRCEWAMVDGEWRRVRVSPHCPVWHFTAGKAGELVTDG
jgi:hypothetical protein